MNPSRALFLIILSILLLPIPVFSNSVPVFVSVDWLAQSLDNPGMVVVDIRGPEQFNKGHIPGSVNAPFASWAIESNGLSLELPPDNVLLNLIGGLGIAKESAVIIVNRTDSDYSRADATRVAWTCILAGVKNVAVLDGGFSRWLKTNQRTTAGKGTTQPTAYDGKLDRSLVASKDYVLRKIGKSIILDVRMPEDYFGIASKEGHIRSALNLPTPWAYASDGTLKSEADLQAMAAGVIGKNKTKEIIVYCGVGGFASTWWFLLTHMLGYQNVKLYDGSMQEWTQDSGAPLTTFSWQ
jgi:thiosulfate/3-mercaptopyruvate sulfurtransferase